MTRNFSELLLKRYENGDIQAATEIYSRYSRRLVKLARRKLTQLLSAKIDPEDITQEAFIAFFDLADQNKVRWDREGDLWRLLAGIVVNQVSRQHQYFAAAKRNVASERGIELDWMTASRNDEATSTGLYELLESILENEKPLARRVLASRLAGHSMEEIARQNDRSPRTIRRIMNNLKSRLVAAHSQLANIPWIQEQHFAEANPDANESGPCLTANHQDYDLIRMIGVGGFGKVYLARNIRSGRVVAFKVLKARWLGNKSAETAFKNEARILSQLRHTHIVHFIEAGPLPNGSWFIVTEFEQGVSLDHVDLTGHDVNDVVGWMTQAASGIATLHTHSIVHGDIKPANLMLNDNRIVLLDFGFAQCRTTSTSPSIGHSKAYSAPEPIAHFPSDVYSFGKLIKFAIEKLDGSQGSPSAQMQSLAELICRMTEPDFEKRPEISQVKTLLQNLQESNEDGAEGVPEESV